MSANQTSRPARWGRSIGLRLQAVLLVAGALPACTGDNLFTGLTSLGGLLGPEVEITAPQNNFSMAVGATVTVTADMTSTQGLTEARFFGVYTGGQPAFTLTSFLALGGVPDTTLSVIMTHQGTTSGNVRMIVEATDALGEKGADTVNIIIQ
jgi:hypothetical protein